MPGRSSLCWCASTAPRLGLARSQGVCPEEALECVQDALCTWLVQRRRGPQPALLASLKLMVKNAARNGRRRHHRLRPLLTLDTLEIAQAEADAEQVLSATETLLRLQVCVAQLREMERAVVGLRLLEERSAARGLWAGGLWAGAALSDSEKVERIAGVFGRSHTPT